MLILLKWQQVMVVQHAIQNMTGIFTDFASVLAMTELQGKS